MKKLMFILLIFILPVFLFSQDQSISQGLDIDDRLTDTQLVREVSTLPSISMEDYGKELDMPPVLPATPAGIQDIDDQLTDTQLVHEGTTLPSVSMEDYGKVLETLPVNTADAAGMGDIDDRESDMRTEKEVIPERIEPSDYYQPED
jgi:hypothetical protein